jgi:hypothetical protein
MGFRFGRSLRLIPGVRLNFSKSGVSASFGVRGASVTVGGRGTHLNLGIPGTGLSYRTRLDQPATFPRGSAPSPAVLPFSPEATPELEEPNGLHYTGRREYRSAHPDTLSSPHLRQLAGFLSEVEARRARLEAAIDDCRRRTGTAQYRVASGRSFPWRFFVSKARVAEIETRGAELAHLLEELENIREGTVIDADFGLAGEARSEYQHLIDAYGSVSRSQMIWDISTSTDIDRFSTRSAATNAIDRTKVTFGTARLGEMDSDFDAMHLANANGGDLYLYPGFLAVRNPRGGFALIDLNDVEIKCFGTDFIEEQTLPGDSEQVGQVWAKSNRDGSPDRRFRDNYQIPLMRYGEISFRSKTGLNEVYQVSNWKALEAFQRALKRYLAALPRTAVAEGSGQAEVPYDAVPDLEIPDVPSVPSLHTVGSSLKAAAAIVVLAIGVILAVGLGRLRPETTAAPRAQEAGQTPASELTPAAAPAESDSASQAAEAPAPADKQPLIGVKISREHCMDLQQRLATLGFKPGPADGTPGRRTIQAFNDWRAAHQLTRVETIDEAAYSDFRRIADR